MTALFRRFLVVLVRILVGARSEWRGCEPDTVRRIYFANHSSHFDTIAVMAALPWPVRRLTHPVAARDYWGKNRFRRFIAETGLRAVLIDRKPKPGSDPLAPLERLLDGRQVDPDLSRRARAPKATRSRRSAAAYSGWRSRFPDVELVPVYLDNLRRILPKGSMLPVPITCTARFGKPLQVEPGEDKAAFLERARAAVLALDGAAA